MPINSKQKGSSFELKVAKLLTEWSGQEFHRTPMSGALHWANDNRVISDIVPPQNLVDEGWPFSIECKKVESSWELNTFVEGTAQFWKHWKQCQDDANRESMIPMLVFSKNYRDTYVAITQSTYHTLNLDIQNAAHIQYQDQKLSIFPLKSFLDKLTCQSLIGFQLLKSV